MGHKLLAPLFALVLVVLGGAAQAQQTSCTQWGGYPFVQGGCVNANDLNAAFNLSPSAIPPRNAFSQGPGFGKFWMDSSTGTTTPTLRQCVNLSGCSATYVASDWMSWGQYNTSTRTLALSAAISPQLLNVSAPLVLTGTNLSLALAPELTVGGGGALSATVGGTVSNPGTGFLEGYTPVFTVTGATVSPASTLMYVSTRRSNSGSAMSDTLPALATTGLRNGTPIVIKNVDASATLTLHAAVSTTIEGSATLSVGAGREVNLLYDATNFAWRLGSNSGDAALLDEPNVFTSTNTFNVDPMVLSPTGTATAIRLPLSDATFIYVNADPGASHPCNTVLGGFHTCAPGNNSSTNPYSWTTPLLTNEAAIFLALALDGLGVNVPHIVDADGVSTNYQVDCVTPLVGTTGFVLHGDVLNPTAVGIVGNDAPSVYAQDRCVPILKSISVRPTVVSTQQGVLAGHWSVIDFYSVTVMGDFTGAGVTAAIDNGQIGWDNYDTDTLASFTGNGSGSASLIVTGIGTGQYIPIGAKVCPEPSPCSGVPANTYITSVPTGNQNGTYGVSNTVTSVSVSMTTAYLNTWAVDHANSIVNASSSGYQIGSNVIDMTVAPTITGGGSIASSQDGFWGGWNPNTLVGPGKAGTSGDRCHFENSTIIGNNNCNRVFPGTPSDNHYSIGLLNLYSQLATNTSGATDVVQQNVYSGNDFTTWAFTWPVWSGTANSVIMGVNGTYGVANWGAFDSNFAVSLGNGVTPVTNTISLATIVSGNLIANSTTGTAEPTSTSLTALIDSALGGTSSQILQRGASAWGPVTVSGDATLAAGGAFTLASVISGSTVGSSTAIPVLTYDAKGRLTSTTTASVVAPAGTLTGTTLAANVVSSSLTSVAGGALVASATTDTTNASNISSGTLATARGGVTPAGWTAFTPSLSCAVGTIGGISRNNNSYQNLGTNGVAIQIDTSFAIGTCTGALTVTGLPVTSNSSARQSLQGIDISTNLGLVCAWGSGSTACQLYTAAGATAITVTDNIVLSGVITQ